MKLKYCCFTGADDQVDIKDLSAIAAEYPFVEWAILYLPGQMGESRCPSASWIKKFAHEFKGHTAMHLCGDALLGFINGDAETFGMMQGFKRIQLNLKFGGMHGKYDPKKLAAQVKAHPEFQFILQYSEDEKSILPLFKDIPNHAVLFDASAGAGISPDKWDAPLAGHLCGYAGGINPDNVAKNLEMITKVAPGYETWIDMESGVRTNDVFDLAKVRRVLDIAKPYVGASAAPAKAPLKSQGK